VRFAPNSSSSRLKREKAFRLRLTELIIPGANLGRFYLVRHLNPAVAGYREANGQERNPASRGRGWFGRPVPRRGQQENSQARPPPPLPWVTPPQHQTLSGRISGLTPATSPRSPAWLSGCAQSSSPGCGGTSGTAAKYFSRSSRRPAAASRRSAPMDQHGCADVPGTQPMFRQVAGQNHIIQFFDHVRFRCPSR
jgi:hypothetical protein